METKRKSILKILLTRIFLVVLLFNILLAFININEAILTRDKNEEALKEKIKQEIVSLTNFQTSALQSLAKTLVIKQSDVLLKLYNVHKKKDLKLVNLAEQFSFLELDSSLHALYIIEKGVIVNTTFKTDLGLNFYNLGQDYRNFLHKIFESDDIYALGFDFEYRTKKLRAYSYFPTHDKKYLIEVGSYSETANEIMQMVKNRLNEIKEENKNIVSLNLWVANQNDMFPLIDDNYNNFILDSLTSFVFLTRRDLTSTFQQDDKNLNAEFLYLQQDESSFLPELTVSLITDVTNIRKPIIMIILRHLVFTSIFLSLILIVILIATNKIKNVFRELIEKTTIISKGLLSERVKVVGNNELTTIAEQFNEMVQKLEESYSELSLTNKIIKDNMELLQQQTNDIVDSITYAERLQKATLPDNDLLDEIIPDRFIIFKPRDVVSGDFYWVKQIKNFKIIVAADCTGHGIPGAFMSMLGMSLLNEIITKSRVDTAGEMLDRLRKKIKKILHQTGKDREAKDGMDMALCIINTETNSLQFAGAFNPMYIIRNKELLEFKGDRMPVGVYILEKTEFKTHEVDLQPGDNIYIFSDGFSDQVGGEKEKKFMAKNLREMLIEHSDKPLAEQKEIYESTLAKWMGENEQIDDIILMGFRVS